MEHLQSEEPFSSDPYFSNHLKDHSGHNLLLLVGIGLTEFTNSGKRGYTSGASPKFHSDALQTLFFAKMIPYCLFTLTFLREIPAEPLQFPSRTKEFKTRFWLLKNSVVTVTLVMEGYFENFCNVVKVN